MKFLNQTSFAGTILLLFFQILFVELQAQEVRNSVNFSKTQKTENSDPHLKIGGEFGFTSPRQKINAGSFSLNPSFFASYRGGVRAEYFFNNQFSLQSGLIFMGEGVSFKEKRAGNDREEGSIYTYANLPIIARFGFLKSDGFNINVHGGFSVGYLLSGDDFEKETDFRTYRDIEINDDFVRVEGSALIGVGMTFPVGEVSGFVDLQYNYGLNSMLDPIITDLKVKNRGLSLAFGVMFGG